MVSSVRRWLLPSVLAVLIASAGAVAAPLRATAEGEAIAVAKSSTTTSVTDAGQVVPYTLTVTNPGSVVLTGVTVTDPLCGDIAGPTGDMNADNSLDLTETWTYTCSHTVSQAEVDAGGNLSNTVTADSIESAPATATLDIPISQVPALQVVKTSTTTAVTGAGQVVSYGFALTNLGNVTLTGITVADPKCDAAPVGPTGDIDADTALDLTETWTYTCGHTVTQAEIDAGGNLSNTVTAGSTESQPVTDILDIPITQTPGLSIAKTSTTTAITAPNQVVPYTLTVTNTGNLSLTGITVTDEKCDAAPAYVSGDTSDDQMLQPTETWTYTCDHTVTPTEADAGGSLSNTVTADSAETEPVTDTLAIPLAGTMSLVKSSATSGVTAAGQVVPYSFTVTSSSLLTLTGVTLTDARCDSAPVLSAGDGNGDGKLQPTETWSYTCSHTVTQPELDAGGNLTNTATADSTESPPVTARVDLPITQTRALALEKVAADSSYAEVGEIIDYSYKVTNAGNVTLTAPITVTDDKATATCPSLPTNGLPPGGFITCTSGYTVTQAALDEGHVTNTAYAQSGTTKSASVSVTVPASQRPAFTLTKSANPPAGTVVRPSEGINYTITYTNTGNVTVQDAVITDVIPEGTDPLTLFEGGAYDAATRVASWHTGTVARGESRTVHVTVTVASGLTTRPEIVNVAKVGGTSSNAVRHPVQAGSITLVKTVDKSVATYGDRLTFTLAATASQGFDQTSVVVTDVVPYGTAYVAGSALPATIATYNSATKTVTWAVGSLAGGTSIRGLSFKVTVLKPTAAADGSIPSRTISNVGAVQSAHAAKTPSNIARTLVPAVLGVKLARKSVQVLPFTGAPALPPLVVGAVLMLGAGVGLAAVRRRSRPQRRSG
jgi:uncharacterized repeat protein (TIGR01451 family)